MKNSFGFPKHGSSGSFLTSAFLAAYLPPTAAPFFPASPSEGKSSLIAATGSATATYFFLGMKAREDESEDMLNEDVLGAGVTTDTGYYTPPAAASCP